MGVIAARLRGVPFQIIAPASVYVSDKPSELLVVRKDSPIRTGAALNGKTFSSPALRDLFARRRWPGSMPTAAIRKRCTRSIAAGRHACSARHRAHRRGDPHRTAPFQTINSGLARVLGKPYDTIAAVHDRRGCRNRRVHQRQQDASNGSRARFYRPTHSATPIPTKPHPGSPT